LLCGSGRTMLMVTGFVSGNHCFLNPLPTNLTSINQSPKKMSHCQRTLHLYQIWCKSAHGKLLGKCTKYNQNFIYLFIPSFSGSHLHVRPVCRFTLNGSNNTDLHKDVPFGVPLQNSHFWDVNRRSHAKCTKYSNFHINETTASMTTTFHTVIKTHKYPCGWSKYAKIIPRWRWPPS